MEQQENQNNKRTASQANLDNQDKLGVEDSTVLFQKKLNNDNVYFKLDIYKGKEYCHIRRHYKNQYDELMPTNNGILLDKMAIEQLLFALQKSKDIWQDFKQESYTRKRINQ